jgi:hypothetical protein
MKKEKKVLASILIVLATVILIASILYFIKPKQDQITIEILEEKKGETDMYVEFIKNNLLSGGPPKDGIPAIDEPQYISAERATIDDNMQIFGMVHNDFVVAYPKDIMYQHEIVNEVIEGEKLSITYCPLTGSIIGYKGKNLGVSGSLYNSNLVFYDRESDIEYPQILGFGLSSEKEKLNTFPVTVTTWKQWKERYPHTKLLSRETGHVRDYDRNPYPGYEDTLRVWFPLAAENDHFHSKKIVFGIEVEKETFAVVKEKVAAEGSISINTERGKTITVLHDPITDTLSAVDEQGEHVKSFDVFWFAWYAYHPDTKIVE